MNVPLPPTADASDDTKLARRTLRDVAQYGKSEAARVSAANALIALDSDAEPTKIDVTVSMSPDEAYRTLLNGPK